MAVERLGKVIVGYRGRESDQEEDSDMAGGNAETTTQ